MPLFITNRNTAYLNIKAIVLPFFDGINSFYSINFFNNNNLYDLYNTFSDKEKTQKLTELEKTLKNKLEKLISINKSYKLENKYSNKVSNLIWRSNYFINQLWQENNKDLSKIIKEYPNLAKIPKEQLIKELDLLENYYHKKEKYKNLEKKTYTKIEKLKKQILTINKIKEKYVITLDVDIKEHIKNPYTNLKASNLSDIYEIIIKLALKNKINKIAIPIIDFQDMPNPNYYISLAKDKIRYLIEKAKRDITVYLLLTNENNDYFKDKQPENIYEKILSLSNRDKDLTKAEIEKRAKREYEEYKKDNIDSRYYLFKRVNRYTREYAEDDYLDFYHDWLLWLNKRRNNVLNITNQIEEKESDVEDLKYWDEKAFWENINFQRKKLGLLFSINTDEFPKYRKNNERILKKLGEDIKIRLIEEEDKDKSIICGEMASKKSQNLQAEIQSLIDSKKESFSQMVLRIIQRANRDKITCYKAANVNKNIFSKIVKDAKGDENADGTLYVYKPEKKIALAFSIALRLRIEEAEELLKKAGYAFSDSPQDIIVKTFIQKGIYDIDLVNQFLFRFHQPLLGSTVRE